MRKLSLRNDKVNTVTEIKSLPKENLEKTSLSIDYKSCYIKDRYVTITTHEEPKGGGKPHEADAKEGGVEELEEDDSEDK